MPRDHPEPSECADADCPRYPCRVYREGWHDGYEEGFAAGHAEGFAEGYAEGFAARPLRIEYVEVPVGK